MSMDKHYEEKSTIDLIRDKINDLIILWETEAESGFLGMTNNDIYALIDRLEDGIIDEKADIIDSMKCKPRMYD